MKKVISRVLGVILSLLMAFYCLDLTAFAEGLPDTQENETEVVAEIETIEETTDVEDAEDEPETVLDEERAETDADEAIEETEVLEDSDDLVEDQEEIADLEEETQEETVDSQEETQEEDIVSEEAETPDALGTSEEEASEEIKTSEETDTKEEDIKDALTEEISEENSDITEAIVIEPEEIYSVEDINNDEVLSDYIGSKVNPKNTVFYSGTMAGNKLSGVNKQMYDKAKDLFARVADGEEAYCVCELKFSELGIDTNKLYSASELGVSSVKDGNGLSEEATAALKKKFGLDKYSSKEVFGAVLRDCPYERYWMGLQISGSGIGYRYTSDGSAMGFYGESLLLYFWPSEDYAGSKDFYVDTNKTKAVAQTINNVNTIIDKAKNYSDLDKVKYYKNQICSLTDYNYDAAEGNYNSEYGNPWQLVWVFDGNPNTKVVCEGYSKAFAYLCEKTTFSDSSINCYIVTGNAGGPHMWNIIHWSDNKNYHADVTFCDTAMTDKFFLNSPKSQNPGNNYTFDIEGTSVTYYFDSEAKSAYSVEELTINSESYTELSDFNVNYDSNIKVGVPATFTLVRQGGTKDCQFKLEYIKQVGKGGYGGTQYSNNHTFSYTFSEAGSYEMKFSVRDAGDGYKTISKTISFQVYGDSNNSSGNNTQKGNGLIKHSDGNWYYEKDGVVQTGYTGLVYHTDKNWYYVQKGVIVWGVNTLVQYQGTWYYVKNSTVDFNFTGIFGYGGTDYYIQKGVLKWGVDGLVNAGNNTWYYLKNSAVQKNFTSLVQYYGTWYYIKNGKLDWNYTGIFGYGGTDYYIQKGVLKWGVNGLTNVGGTWYYLKNSAVQKGYSNLVQLGNSWYYVQKGVLVWGVNTLVQYNGTWYYVKNSTVDFNYTGIFGYGGTDYYIQKGAIKWGVNGLTNVGGTWYYLKNSAVQKGYTGLVQLGNSWYYVQKGVLKWGVKTLVQYGGTWYYVNNSTLDWNFTGICSYGGTDYYIQKGVLKWGVNGLTNVGGTWYYLKNSSVQRNYTGLVEYNNTLYYVQKGVLIWGYNGKASYNGKTYTVKNSTAKK